MTPAPFGRIRPSDVTKALALANANARTLHCVGEHPHQDASIYMDVATGERRCIPARHRVIYGLKTAFELSPTMT